MLPREISKGELRNDSLFKKRLTVKPYYPKFRTSFICFEEKKKKKGSKTQKRMPVKLKLHAFVIWFKNIGWKNVAIY